MRKLAKWGGWAIAIAVVWSAGSAQAAYRLEKDENTWISLGVGMRAELGVQKDASGGDWEKDLEFDNGRIYINGSIFKGVGFEFNTDTNLAGLGEPTPEPGTDPYNDNIRILDAIAKFKFSDAVQVWAGRFLPPSDRANLSGPYFLNTWNFPGVPWHYTNVWAGRDNGAAVWGQFKGGKFKYQVGAFQGNRNSGAPNIAARLTLNLLDPEPGYYNASTYYGEKDILAIGAVYQVQPGGSRGAVNQEKKAYQAWNIDLMFEKKLGDAGTISMNGAVYGYSNGGLDQNAAGLVDTTSDGIGFFALAGYILPMDVGFSILKGKIEPTVRFQYYKDETLPGDPKTKRIDAGINWIFKGHNALLTLNYGNQNNGTSWGNVQEIIVGIQLQYW